MKRLCSILPSCAAIGLLAWPRCSPAAEALREASPASTSARAPAAPTELVATAVSPSRIDLTWKDNETGFEVRRRELGTSLWRMVGTVDRDVTFFDDTSLPPGKSFVYRVHARNARGASMSSNEVRAW